MKPIVKILLIAAGVIVFALLNLAAFNFGRGTIAKKLAQTFKRPTPAPTPTPTPMPQPKILNVHGKYGFTISGGNPDAAQISVGFIDPIDASPNQTQTINIGVIPNKLPVTSVTATMITDNKKTPVTLKKIDQQGKMEIWEGSWTINNTYVYTYGTVFEAVDTAGNKNQIEALWK